MKPREFDELIRQKFDQNDLEYNPRNWERLSDQMEGRTKKRSVMLWWAMPLAGVAASVALAMGILFLWRSSSVSTNPDVTATVAAVSKGSGNTSRNHSSNGTQADIQNAAKSGASSSSARHSYSGTKIKGQKNAAADKNTGDLFAINYQNAVGNIVSDAPAKEFDFMSGKNSVTDKKKDKKKEIALNNAVSTFKPEAEVKKVPKLSIILSGGINRGSQNSGYMAGATIRKMVSSKVFIESDVAFASSNNTQSTEYLSMTGGAGASASKHGVAAKNSNIESSKVASTTTPTGIIMQQNVNYNLNYVQVSPGIGYKLMKRMSLGAGPDFQQVLADNRPAPSTVDRGTIQEAPLFDIGFVGKTEYTITQNIHAAVYYRKGINNVITPMDKYIERDYLQFQVKCAIFNK